MIISHRRWEKFCLFVSVTERSLIEFIMLVTRVYVCYEVLFLPAKVLGRLYGIGNGNSCLIKKFFRRRRAWVCTKKDRCWSSARLEERLPSPTRKRRDESELHCKKLNLRIGRKVHV